MTLSINRPFLGMANLQFSGGLEFGGRVDILIFYGVGKFDRKVCNVLDSFIHSTLDKNKITKTKKMGRRSYNTVIVIVI